MPTRNNYPLTNRGREFTFPKGTNVLGSSSARRYIYWLRSGHVRLSNDGHAIIDHLESGSFFGEKAFLDLRRVRETAMTLSPVTVIRFGKAEFLRRMQQEPGFATKTLRNLACRLSRCEHRISSFVTEPVETRLARLLLLVAPAGTGWGRLPFTLTNPEISRMIGASRWRVSHFLNRFQRQGWLRRQEGLWVHRRRLAAYLRKKAPR
jgi:CRP-like cAMP-binding protein